jgi:TolB-like protein
MGVRLLVFTLVWAITSTGCSFIWVTRPVPKEEASQYVSPPPCTDSYWMPGLDTAAAALFAIPAIVYASMSKEEYIKLESSSSSSPPDPNGRFALAAGFGGMALTGLASAIYGYYYVAKCKQQVATEPVAEPYFAPQMLPSPPPPAPVPPSPVFAAVQVRGKHLAVLEFQGKDLDQDILMTFSDTVRGGALQGLQPHGVVVMTRENMLVLLRGMGKRECAEGDCEVETARNIGADYVISGKVVRVEQVYFVTLKLHEAQGGSLLGTDTVEGASQVEVLRSLREHARQLTTAAFGPGPDSVLPTR